MPETAVEITTLNVLNSRRSLPERLPRLATSFGSPDVFAAQEVLYADGSTTELDPSLEQVFAEAGLVLAAVGQRTWSESASAIYYRPETFALIDSGVIVFPAPAVAKDTTPDIAWAHLRPLAGGRDLLVFSTHLAWGGRNEWRRLAAAKEIDRVAESKTRQDPDLVVVACGDFNTTPDSDTLRWLRGLAAVDPGTLWVDVWPWLHPNSDGYTQVPTNEYAVATAREVGIPRPELLPARRIDYVLVRGWAYGRLGPRPEIGQWGSGTSDHAGLYFRFAL